MFSKKFRAGIDTQWEVMLILLTEPEPTNLTKAKIAEKLHKSDTSIGNIAKGLYNDGFIIIETDYKIKGTSKQYLKLDTPNMLKYLVKEITNDEKVATYYHDQYSAWKTSDIKKSSTIDYNHYYESWKDLFADVAIKELVKKTPSIIYSFILFFDLLLTLAELDHSMAKEDSFNLPRTIKIPVPVRIDFLTTGIMPDYLFRLFIGLIQFNTIEFIKEVADLSFTKRLKIWLKGGKYDFLGILPLLQEFKIDLTIEPATQNLNNKIVDSLYTYYSEYVEKKKNYQKLDAKTKEDLKFEVPSYGQLLESLIESLQDTTIKKPKSLVDLSQKLSSFIWNEQKEKIKIPVDRYPFINHIDGTKSSFITIPLKDGSAKTIPVEFEEILKILS